MQRLTIQVHKEGHQHRQVKLALLLGTSSGRKQGVSKPSISAVACTGPSQASVYFREQSYATKLQMGLMAMKDRSVCQGGKEPMRVS